ncbi:MAG: ribosome-associated translation inhibitor RaiA [Bacteroidaceae bacterium]|nr:ribosome-associated translation inhibitor RaiA [Bacteroidaceae bacterium]MBR1467193.1 ribosome-associated translation inhibitor RaiA [Bacteroidaceae bacterium]
MDIKIQAIHFEATEKLQDFIQKKVGKLERFESEIGKVEVALKVVKPESALNKEADIRVYVKGKTLFASETCDTFEEAVDKSCEILVRQIEKHKNK